MRFDDDATTAQALLSGQIDAIGVQHDHRAAAPDDEPVGRLRDTSSCCGTSRTASRCAAARPICSSGSTPSSTSSRTTASWTHPPQVAGRAAAGTAGVLSAPRSGAHRMRRRPTVERLHHHDGRCRQVLRQLPALHDINLHVRRRRAHRAVRPVRLRQVHADPLHQPARAPRRRAASSSTATEVGPHTKGLDKVRREIGMVFQQFNLFPHLTVLQNCMLAPMKVRGTAKARGRGPGAATTRAGAHSRTGGQVSGATLGRPAAARGDRARAVHAAQGDAVRRTDLGARPRDGQGSARHHDRPGGGRHDHAVRDARDGLRAQRRAPRDLHGRRARSSRKRRRTNSSPTRDRSGPGCSSGQILRQ